MASILHQPQPNFAFFKKMFRHALLGTTKDGHPVWFMKVQPPLYSLQSARNLLGDIFLDLISSASQESCTCPLSEEAFQYALFDQILHYVFMMTVFFVDSICDCHQILRNEFPIGGGYEGWLQDIQRQPANHERPRSSCLTLHGTTNSALHISSKSLMQCILQTHQQ